VTEVKGQVKVKVKGQVTVKVKGQITVNGDAESGRKRRGPDRGRAGRR
jgi:hypothetical protein